MNKVILMGRLTRDPEVRYSQGERQMVITNYTLAVDRRGARSNQNNGPTADFIRCIAFDRHGEFARDYFHQGMQILITGRIQTGSYTNRDGVKVYTTDIIVDSQEFTEKKSTSDNSNTQAKAPAQQTYNQQQGYGRQPASQQANAPQQGYRQQQGYANQPNYGGQQGYQAPNGYNNGQPAGQPYGNAQPQGFAPIPDAVEDDGLPFA